MLVKVLSNNNKFSSFLAMQNEYKVIRLELQAIHVHYSYILAEMSADKAVPHLVERRLLSPAQANEVNEQSSPPVKASAILQALKRNMVVGTLPTFCAVLVSIGLSDMAESLASS